MGLRINTNIEAMEIHRQLVLTNNKLGDSLKRISSGYRINSAKDDASGFAVANMFKAKISSMRVAYQNGSEANSMLQVADGAYNKIYDVLVRMKDLATQAASGQTENRDKLQVEFAELQAEIDRIAQSTTYSTKNAASLQLINGSSDISGGITFMVGATNNSQNMIGITLSAACTGALGVGSNLLSIDSVGSARAAMDALDLALGSINTYMGKVGSYQNRLQITMENLSTGIENFSASESTIRDVDMAYEVMNFTREQILQQSGMAMLAQANTAPQQVLTLLR
ncbi:MAG TPA: flagellin [Syntrophobacteraceae bacterium]|nr:flagellin [Syntrophobacteraceae bacterium]